MSKEGKVGTSTQDLRRAVSAGVADMSRNKDTAIESVMEDFSYGDFVGLHNEVGGSIRVTIIAIKTLLESLDLESEYVKDEHLKEVQDISGEFADKADNLVGRFNLINEVLESNKIKTFDPEKNIHENHIQMLIETVAQYQDLSVETSDYFLGTEAKIRVIGDVVGMKKGVEKEGVTEEGVDLSNEEDKSNVG